MTINDNALVPTEQIAQAILDIRGQKVMIDADLAELYGVPTKRFNEQVRRNLERFPPDFMFQLTQEEWDALRSQFATLKTGRGQHRKYLPYMGASKNSEFAKMQGAEKISQRRICMICKQEIFYATQQLG